MKTLLVTGCAGFIGSNFCRLYEKEFRIVGVDILARGSHPENPPAGISFHRVDICAEEDLEAVLANVPALDGIFHFAAESHVDHSIADDSRFWASNVLGTRNLARMAIRRKTRLLYVSTDEVYGSSDGNGGAPFVEGDPLNPRNPYAASKAAAELLLRSYGEAYGLDVVVTRGSNTLGPRQAPDKLIPKVILHFLEGRPFPLFRTPARRMWLGVEDHCRAVMMAFQLGTSGETYNVAPDDSHELETAHVVERIHSLLGRGDIRLVDDRPAYDLRYRISPRKIRDDLGWSPQQRMPSVLEDTVAWYRDNSYWLRTHPLNL